MRLEVISDTSKECFTTKVNTQHADNRASFKIADMIEDLIHLQCISNGDLNRVGCPERVQVKRLLHTFSLRTCQLS